MGEEHLTECGLLLVTREQERRKDPTKESASKGSQEANKRVEAR